ncbi:expressed unknown protein [Seminavis robusta]|uniref:Uncharacterized protein n=1 Tax=Seminavis robusta TaxID=568900 RepID=A0A9N8DWD3_9STRA|nr:expressed unknown protein [Seminavis robusta]|eukprot:Sro323_g117410.1 n/a (202) ;mRNA; f:70664-71411
MTIHVEREALLRLLASKPPSTPPLSTVIDCNDEYEYVSIEKPAFSDGVRLQEATDEDSVYTSSTASLSLDADDDKRVSFVDPLVTEVWTREYTSKDEASRLFYSTEETQRFRQEYRLERKLLSDLAIDVNDCAKDTDKVFSSLADGKWQPQGRHLISRVVVLHNDKLETFFDTEKEASSRHEESNDFFDSDSFWSGSITWY